MGTILKLEELGLFLLSVFLFSGLEYAWWVFLVLLLAPDLGMVGYLLGPSVGAASYNLTHHKGLAVLVYAAGGVWSAPAVALAGVIMLGHSSLDRVLGYGLKYPDSFQHTHLGWIGRGAPPRPGSAG
jgi:hypothetical protein